MKRNSGPANILPVILAGGEGLRLAPISTPEQPKPFVPLPDGNSLLTHTLKRVADTAYFLPPLLVGQEKHRFSLLNHAREADCAPCAILLEPQAKNTTMAIAVAAHYALHYAPDTILAILPADQVIEQQAAWLGAVLAATKAAQGYDKLCLLGIAPTRPDPHFGYLRPGLPLASSAAMEVIQFIEKPDDPQPLMGHCYWNAGQFFATPACLAALIKAHAPEIDHAARAAFTAAHTAWEFTSLGATAYLSAVPRAFDRAIVEKSRVIAVRLEAQWSDVGTLEAWEGYTGRSAIDYNDLPVRTDRPWGFYEMLSATPGRLEKRLTLYPGCRLSLQRHSHRSEQWQLLTGQAEIQLDGELFYPVMGQQISIPAHSWHRLHNIGREKLIIHEIQTGMPSEADIERREDDYGRNIIQ